MQRFYGPWSIDFICQRPTIGSTWYRGNFTLGLAIDNHPRFVNVILCLLAIEIGSVLSETSEIEAWRRSTLQTPD